MNSVYFYFIILLLCNVCVVVNKYRDSLNQKSILKIAGLSISTRDRYVQNNGDVEDP